MALHEQRLQSVDFVQSWVNSLPAQREPACQLSPPSSCSSTNSHGRSSATTTSSSEQILAGGYAGLAPSPRSTRSPDPPSPGHASQMNSKSVGEGHQTRSEVSGVNKSATKQPLRRKNSRLSWMHSNYSSFNSESSSIDILLEERKGNPEQVLMNLGFGVCDPSIGARLPARFLASETHANGINMQNFIRGHPDLGIYHDPESSIAFGEFYTRLPPYYRQVATSDKHTTLHKNFSMSSIDMQSEQSYLPLTMHTSEDGTMFASILTKSNTEQLEKQGFYSEHSSQSSLPHQSSVSSISTNDCTIDSIDTPSPIILNNSPTSPDSGRNPFISYQSSGSDSVFSSTESYAIDQRIRAKLEAIQEKTINEMCDDDLEEGISFVYRRRSDGDLIQQSEVPICEETPLEEVNIHEKRKAFARMKSHSFDQEILTQMLKEQLSSVNSKESNSTSPMASHLAPVIVTTDTSQEHPCEPVIPKQSDGLLQVMFNPESFDSVDSDTGTIVPSPYASPYQGMSPNTSRNGSISLLPAMESFELEEVQSCDAGASATTSTPGDDSLLPLPTSKRKRAKLQRSVSERSDSDSSGIADVDCKSSHGQVDVGESKNSSTVADQSHLLLPNCCQDGSITSSTQTLNSISAKTSTTCITVINTYRSRPRRSSESDLSDMRYYSASSSITNSNRQSPSLLSLDTKYRDAVIQTDSFTCLSCGNIIADDLAQWQTNNLPIMNRSSLPSSCEKTTQENSSIVNNTYNLSYSETPKFYISNADDDSSAALCSINNNMSLQDGGSPDNSGSSPDLNAHDKLSYSQSVHSVSAESSNYSITDYVCNLADTSAALEKDHQVEEICSEMSQDLKLLKELLEKYNISQPSASNNSGDEEAMRQDIVTSLELASSTLSPDVPSTDKHSPQSASILSQGMSFKPLSVDCPPETASKSYHCMGDAADTQHDSCRLPKMGYHSFSGYPGEPLSLTPFRHRHGSVSSTPNSVLSTPNSRTPSSASSSLSRLSGQLKLAEAKYRYEKQIADLEIQRNKLALQMKDEEIEYWKGIAEQCGVD